MLSVLAWVPILGPILQGLFGLGGKLLDTKVATINANVEAAKVSAQIIHDTDSIGLRLLRDLYCAPAVIHLWFTSWDTFIAESPHIDHGYMWHIASYPPSYSWYIPSVAGLLLGNIGFNIWKLR